MTIELAQKIVVPRIQAYSLDSVEALRTSKPYEFEGELSREIPRDSFGQEYRNIHSNSIVLADQAALWNTYLLSKLGKINLPQDVNEVLSYLFERQGYGNVTNDACDYDNGKKGLRKTKETDRSVRWVKTPVKFEENDGGWKAIGGEEKYILVPAPGYVESTGDGSYNPETGTPFSTVDSRKAAEKSWTNKGFSPEFAKLAVSYFFSREEGQGTSAVGRYCYSGGYGRFNVNADGNPDDRDDDVGSFPASRLSSGARPDSERTYEDGRIDGRNELLYSMQTFLQKLKE